MTCNHRTETFHLFPRWNKINKPSDILLKCLLLETTNQLIQIFHMFTPVINYLGIKTKVRYGLLQCVSLQCSTVVDGTVKRDDTNFHFRYPFSWKHKNKRERMMYSSFINALYISLSKAEFGLNKAKQLRKS